MKVYSTSFTLSTYERTEVSDITKLVRDAVQQFAVTTGIALINTLHTTCAVFINEFQSALIDDLKGLMEGLVPERGGYRHDDPRVSDCERGNPLASARRAARPQRRRRRQQRRADARPVPVRHLRRARWPAEAGDQHPGARRVSRSRPASV